MYFLLIILVGCFSIQTSWLEQVNGDWNNATLWSPSIVPSIVPSGYYADVVIGQPSWKKEIPVTINITQPVYIDRIDSNYNISVYIINSVLEVDSMRIPYGHISINGSILSVSESLKIDSVKLYNSYMYLYINIEQIYIVVSKSCLWTDVPTAFNNVAFIDGNSTLKGNFIYTGNYFRTRLNDITISVKGTLHFNSNKARIILEWTYNDLDKKDPSKKYIILDSFFYQSSWKNVEIIFDPIMYDNINPIVHNNGFQIYITFEYTDF